MPELQCQYEHSIIYQAPKNAFIFQDVFNIVTKDNSDNLLFSTNV